ncbi:hypothetical protein ACIRG5_26155 [Lentzea sp. NPDC102401]
MAIPRCTFAGLLAMKVGPITAMAATNAPAATSRPIVATSMWSVS